MWRNGCHEQSFVHKSNFVFIPLQLNKENKNLKRISMLYMAKLGPEVITEEISLDDEDTPSDSDSGEVCTSLDCQQKVKGEGATVSMSLFLYLQMSECHCSKPPMCLLVLFWYPQISVWYCSETPSISVSYFWVPKRQCVIVLGPQTSVCPSSGIKGTYYLVAHHRSFY